ncbi:glycosyltransferase family A protein [Haloferax sp. Q22]|uniref:glycosyltransferase family 2 protein n=1 Tax=Haloferax sp. (strain Q22) TaxID=1526048 RepID=UPI000737D109|nr:glycosyltransferase family A protein [Haloferax sp. Q22]
MVRYTVAVCNYNMAETLERSLESILGQLTPEFEVLVVDGGSDDGSVSLLRDLQERHETLRVVELDADPERHLGRDRQIAVERARGDYVLPQLDADDVYDDCIRDFVSVYHAFEAGFDGPLYLNGQGLNIAPASLLERIPYRNLPTSEDRDLWRRLLADDAMLRLEHGSVRESIGYERSVVDEMRYRDFAGKVADAQCGVTLTSCLKWAATAPTSPLERSRPPLTHAMKRGYDCLTFLLAYPVAASRESFPTPTPMRDRAEFDRRLRRVQATAAEHESRLGVTVDRSSLGEAGETAFFGRRGDA